MIITHKQFPDYRKFEIEYEGRPLKMEVGKMAELCNAAVLVTYGETTVLVTCTASARPKDGIDYFPLSVDFNEKRTQSAASQAASCAARVSPACRQYWHLA